MYNIPQQKWSQIKGATKSQAGELVKIQSLSLPNIELHNSPLVALQLPHNPLFPSLHVPWTRIRSQIRHEPERRHRPLNYFPRDGTEAPHKRDRISGVQQHIPGQTHDFFMGSILSLNKTKQENTQPPLLTNTENWATTRTPKNPIFTQKTQKSQSKEQLTIESKPEPGHRATNLATADPRAKVSFKAITLNLYPTKKTTQAINSKKKNTRIAKNTESHERRLLIDTQQTSQARNINEVKDK